MIISFFNPSVICALHLVIQVFCKIAMIEFGYFGEFAYLCISKGKNE